VKKDAEEIMLQLEPVLQPFIEEFCQAWLQEHGSNTLVSTQVDRHGEEEMASEMAATVLGFAQDFLTESDHYWDAFEDFVQEHDWEKDLNDQ